MPARPASARNARAEVSRPEPNSVARRMRKARAFSSRPTAWFHRTSTARWPTDRSAGLRPNSLATKAGCPRKARGGVGGGGGALGGPGRAAVPPRDRQREEVPARRREGRTEFACRAKGGFGFGQRCAQERRE